MPGNPIMIRDQTTAGIRTTARNPIMPRNRAMSVNPIISRNQAMPRSLSTHVQQKIPVKAAMAALGYCDNYLRLPLVPMEEDHYQGMLQRMRELGLPV